MSLNIETYTELVDYGVASNTSAITFDRTRVSFNTGDYDGSPSYFFEIIGSNNDSVSRDVELVNSSGSVVATISLASTDTIPARFRASLTPTAGDNNYRVKVAATNSANELQVWVARIIVQQTAATKTRIQIPLCNARNSDVSNLTTRTVNGLSSETYVTIGQFSLFLRTDANFTSYISGSPFELEVVLGRVGVGTAYATLWNETDNAQVANSEVSTEDAGTNLLSTTFTSSETNFDDGDNYGLRLKGASTTSEVFRACVYIYLDNLALAEIYTRYSKQEVNLVNSRTRDQCRILIDTSKFSNPTFYTDVSGRESSAGDLRYYLYDVGTSDTSDSGVQIAGSETELNSATQTRSRSGSFSPDTGDRFIFQAVENTATTGQFTTAFLVIVASESTDLNINVSDSIAVGENVNSSLEGDTDLNINVSDSISIIDIPHYPDDTIIIGESVQISIISSTDLSISVSDSISITENVEANNAFLITVSDTITISESTDLLLISYISVSDSISITENVNVTLVFNLSVSDSISIAESVSVDEPALVIHVSETITITEKIRGFVSWTQQVPTEGEWEEQIPTESEWTEQTPTEGEWTEQTPTEGEWEEQTPTEVDWEKIDT